MPLCPQSVLITGANRGLGFEFVKQFVQRATPPKFVFATCRSPDTAKELHDLSKENPTIKVLKLDILDSESIANCAEAVSQTVKEAGLNLLINNAGMNVKDSSLLDVNPDDMVEMYKVNTVGPLMVTRTFLPLLKTARVNPPVGEGGSLSINQSAVLVIASIMGSIELTKSKHNYYGYRSSKSALNMVNRLLSVELKEHGIFMVGIHPGWVKTDMGGQNADLTIEESIRYMLAVMDTFEGEETHGKYLKWDGNELPW